MNSLLSFFLVLSSASAACKDRCDDEDSVLRRYTMCKPGEEQRQICTFLPEYRLIDGYVCGPCDYEAACPPPGSISELANYKEMGLLVIPKSSDLCALWLVSTAGKKMPVARSYRNGDWETYSGDYEKMTFECDSNKCSVRLPELSQSTQKEFVGGYRYELVSFNRTALPTQDKIARFLEQSTFGPTREEIDSFPTTPAAWIQQQQEEPISSHRQLYREYLNHRSVFPSNMGIPTRPCEKGTRYRRYAFSDKDRDNAIEVQTDGPTGRKILLINGQRRSVVPNVYAGASGNTEFPLPDGLYPVCRAILNAVGARIRVTVSGQCVPIHYGNRISGNPPVFFDAQTPPSNPIVQLDSHAIPVDAQYSQRDLVQELFLESPLNDDVCIFAPPTTGYPPFDVIGVFNGQGFIHDPRFSLYNNTLEDPKRDSGWPLVEVSKDLPNSLMRTLCFSATMNFLNEDRCIVSSEAGDCGAAVADGVSSTDEIQLTYENFQRIYDASGGTRFVYAVTGLRQGSDSPYYPPCSPSTRSRWVPVSPEDCAVSSAGEDTIDVFAELIRSSSDTNPNLRDVRSQAIGFSCSTADENAFGFQVMVDGQCWKNVHQSHLQVYDFTRWVQRHPGGVAAITQFAVVSMDFNLVFPAGHDMSRWDETVQSDLSDLGRLGDTRILRTDQMDTRVAGQSHGSNVTVVCGSPHEVANKKEKFGSLLQGAFDSVSLFNRTTPGNVQLIQRISIWLDNTLYGSDQLRQRIAWALSQILVVSPGSIATNIATERFVTFYDIFVRNAFGNYRDVLKEVSYSPLMAEMLSFLGSVSTAFVWERKQRIEYADENYAREVMQLFSIGLVVLHNNGTQIVDDLGRAVESYSNDDIAEYARLWTGFTVQPNRGNIESPTRRNANYIDPLRIEILRRDSLPKMGLWGRYVGDGYPLCKDLPIRHFLRKGATYRLLGSRAIPRMLLEPESWATDETVTRLKLGNESSLHKKLCNKTNEADEACNYRTKVMLDEDLPCSSTECIVDTPRIIELEHGIYYEYSRVPCAFQAYFADAKLVKRRGRSYSCENPALESAAVACCAKGTNQFSGVAEEYNGEHTTFETAKERCTRNNMDICRFPWVNCENCNFRLGHWTHLDCDLNAKISQVGTVAVVHMSNSQWTNSSGASSNVREDAKTFFRVHWSTPIEDELLSDYEAKCEELGCSRDSYDNLCLCPVTVADEAAFIDRPPSVTEVLNELHIGSFEPGYQDARLQPTDLGNGVIMYSLDGLLSAASVFEVTDGNGLTQWRKNLRSTVFVGTSNLSFRNPPHLISLTSPDPRDGYYETEAGLDHYFYHQNTAPFLALRLAQRFGISNPTPRFVEVIATAFRTGRYQDPDTGISFGSEEYGDLISMVAAILLDHESRSEILDVDPAHGSVLEPFLKFVRTMRSMEFKPDADRPFIRFGQNLQLTIGQQAHTQPSVFSFFLPEYSPQGVCREARLVCPECQVLTGPKSISLLNGLLSLLKYGLDSAFNGFGIGRRDGADQRVLGDSSFADGSNGYASRPDQSSEEVVAELSRLLTSGRLTSAKQSQLVEVYNDALARGDAKEGLINVQQLIVTMPEFHSNAISANDGEILPPTSPSNASVKPYKAVIQLMLAGGMDSYNMLVPHICAATNEAGVTVDQQYRTERGELGFTASERTLTIIVDDQWGQPCSVFAIHEELPLVAELYNEGDLVFFANTGLLGESGSTKSSYQEKTPVRLFAHNTMQREVKTVDPWGLNLGTGALGRLATVLSDEGFNVDSMAIDNPSISLEPEAEGPTPLVVSRSGADLFGAKPASETLDVEAYLMKSNADSLGYSSVFGEMWSSEISNGIRQASTLKTQLDSAEQLGDHWPTELPDYGEQFSTISKLINTHDLRGTDRDLFYAEIDGWDHHSNLKTNLGSKFSELNQSLSWLVDELKHQGVWDDVAVIITSDFGRTITQNSGGGSDHAWGGHYFMMGGSVKGGKILGKYPKDLTSAGPLNIGRGRLIPTTSWDAVWNGVNEWMGVNTEEGLDYCLPTRTRSDTAGLSKLMTKEDLFTEEGGR